MYIPSQEQFQTVLDTFDKVIREVPEARVIRDHWAKVKDNCANFETQNQKP